MMLGKDLKLIYLVDMKWKFVFNSNNKVWPNIGLLLEAVYHSGYKFFIWDKHFYFIGSRKAKSDLRAEDEINYYSTGITINELTD